MTEASGAIKIVLSVILFVVCVGVGARLEYEGLTAWLTAAPLLALCWWTWVSPDTRIASFQRAAFIVTLIVSAEFLGTTEARHDMAGRGRQDRVIAETRDDPQHALALLHSVSREDLQALRPRLTPEVGAELARRKADEAQQYRIREAEEAKLARERAANPVRQFFDFISWLIHPSQ